MSKRINFYRATFRLLLAWAHLAVPSLPSQRGSCSFSQSDALVHNGRREVRRGEVCEGATVERESAGAKKKTGGDEGRKDGREVRLVPFREQWRTFCRSLRSLRVFRLSVARTAAALVELCRGCKLDTPQRCRALLVCTDRCRFVMRSAGYLIFSHARPQRIEPSRREATSWARRTALERSM